MTTKNAPIVPLAELEEGQEADFFALLASKEELKTRENKPYFKVGFRDARRLVTFPIWIDSAWGEECRKRWSVGVVYKLRAVYRETSYGPQLDIHKIREATDADAAQGFEPTMFLPHSRYAPESMFAELRELAETKIADLELRALTLHLLDENRERLLTLPAATKNHHSFVGGYLEHVLSVTRNGLWLAEKYDAAYPDLRPRLNVGLVAAGCILHDIDKLREIELHAEGASYTESGTLIGHLLQGRDLVREAAAGRKLDPETLLRLEHLIISHQRLPEWGSPKQPMTPEALLVHYADDIDAKYSMMYDALGADSSSGAFTSRQNPLHQVVFRGAASDAP